MPIIFKSFEEEASFENRSIQIQFDTGYEIGSFIGTQTAWNYQYSPDKAESEWIHPKYYELIIQANYNQAYIKGCFLSSRCTAHYPNLGRFDFRLFRLQKNRLGEENLYFSDGKYNDGVQHLPLRPIVSIPLSTCYLSDSTIENTYDISPK